MTGEQYHADPCPTPSLSASIGKKLLRLTPRHAAASHPRLSGVKPNEPTPAMLFGSVVHKLVLGAGSRVKVLDFDDYRTADARKARDAAIAAGRLPILAKDFDRADLVAEAVRERCRKVNPKIFTGQAELVAIWQENGIWCRAMMDCVDNENDPHWFIDDLKTSGQDISPFGVGKTIASMNYELQAAFYERGVKALAPKASVNFSFAFCETEAPFEATVVKLDGAAREIGRRQVCAAIEVWRRCQERGEWLGYPAEIVTAELPPWHVAAWETRETMDPMLEGVNY
jgi:hypothetical protein